MMTDVKKSSYSPDYAVPPGATIQDSIDSLGWTQTELANRLGLTHKTVNLIISGKAPITPDTAVLLERVLGGKASFWLNRETIYRERLAKLEAAEKLSSHAEWLKTLPLKQMIERGLIKPYKSIADQVDEVLRFFMVGSVDAWRKTCLLTPDEVAFRSSESFKRSPESVATWLRAAAKKAGGLELEDFDRNRFKRAVKAIRSLCTQTPEASWHEMVSLCANAGVALVFVREFPKTCSSGASFLLPSGNPCIVLSGRHGTDDHFWFTFFHEAAHVVLHLSKSKKSVFIDSGEVSATDDERELEANEAAGQLLISNDSMSQLLNRSISEGVILSFSNFFAVSPGIVIGRLQKEGVVPWNSSLSRLKHRVNLDLLESA